MNNIKYIIGLIIALMLIASTTIVTRQCNPCPDIIVTSDTVYVYDSVPIIDSFPMPIPYEVIRWYPKYIDTGSIYYIDTTKCCENLSKLKLYNRIIKDDSSLYIAINDSIYNNSLLGFTSEIKNRRATKIINNITNIDNDKIHSLYLDMGAKGNTINPFLGIGATYSWKKGKFGCMYYLDKSVAIKYGFTIKRW